MRNCSWLVLALICTVHSFAADESLETDKKALTPVKAYVGSWRGGGSYKDSNKGSWVEEAEWTWEFKNGRAALVFTATDGKYFSGARLEPGAAADSFNFSGTLPDKKTTETYSGTVNKDGDVIFVNQKPADGRPSQITVSVVAKGKRLVMLYQKKVAANRFSAMAEVGYTLKGSGFGKDSQGPECVVTGGTAKTAVTYKGETYYVCCGGCREAFEENPEKEIAAYKKRKAEEKAERAKR